MARRKQVSAQNVNKDPCKTCIFGKGAGIITPERQAEIQAYLIDGTNHLCHTTNRICRGGRDWQLTIWYRLGRLAAPTDEALYAAMRAVGIEPS